MMESLKGREGVKRATLLAAAPVTTTELTGSALAEPRAVASDTTVGTGGSPAKDAIDRTKLPLAEFKFQCTIGKSSAIRTKY
jgi:hypothetical protein